MHSLNLLPGPLVQPLRKSYSMLHSVILLLNMKVGGTVTSMSLAGLDIGCETAAGMIKVMPKSNPGGGCSSQGLLRDEAQ